MVALREHRQEQRQIGDYFGRRTQAAGIVDNTDDVYRADEEG
jgi:hypothetical protein